VSQVLAARTLKGIASPTSPSNAAVGELISALS